MITANAFPAVTGDINANLPLLAGLGAKPKASYAYLWCDFIELRCLTSPDHRFSRGDLEEMFSELAAVMHVPLDEEEDEDEDEDSEARSELQREAEYGSEQSRRLLEISAGKEPASGLMPADDRAATRSGKIFSDLAFRARTFNGYYPFSLSADGQEIALREIDSAERQLYLQLLLSSSLRLVTRERRGELAEAFEATAHKIFQCLMPQGWEVHRFGAKGASSRFKGHLFVKFQALADAIKETLKVKKRHFHCNNYGDGGLDLVAWHPLGDDGRVALPVAFAQCGCAAEEWSLKSLEGSPSRLGTVLTHQHPWATYYFMPQDLYESTTDGPDWQRRIALTASIVIDRLRLIRLATQYGIAESCADSEELVFEAMVTGVLAFEN
jgi:hypothetical protein